MQSQPTGEPVLAGPSPKPRAKAAIASKLAAFLVQLAQATDNDYSPWEDYDSNQGQPASLSGDPFPVQEPTEQQVTQQEQPVAPADEESFSPSSGSDGSCSPCWDADSSPDKLVQPRFINSDDL